MSLHSFDPEIAARVGVNSAVIYQNIVFWIEKNKANDKHFHDGKYWTYNSISAFEQMFSYLTTSQIRTAIKHLLESNLIVEGNFNKKGYDRTKWYSVNSQIHLSNLANGIAENRKPIPDIKPDIKPDNNISSDDDFEFRFNLLYNDYPRKIGKGAARKALKVALKKTDYENLFSKVIDFSIAMEGKDPKYIPHMATWLNQERWEDEQ